MQYSVLKWLEKFYDDTQMQCWMLGCPNKQEFRKLFTVSNLTDTEQKVRDDIVNKLIALTPEFAYRYAHDYLLGPFPAGEKAIATSGHYSYFYARYIRQPFPAGEAAMINDVNPSNSSNLYYYARIILKHRWPEAEPIIAKKSEILRKYVLNCVPSIEFHEFEKYFRLKGNDAYWYASKLTERRFPIGEPLIKKNIQLTYYYTKRVIKGPWPEVEEIIAKSAYFSYLYAYDILDSPFPLGEDIIATNPEVAYKYAKNVIGGPWPNGEDIIKTIPKYAYWYARNVIGGPWPEGEDIIATCASSSFHYATHLLYAPFPKGEKAIEKYPAMNNMYQAEFYNKTT